MAVIMHNYAKAIGFVLPKAHDERTFADSSKIETNAKNSIKAMQMAGIIVGKSGNKFDPQAIATKSEISEVLKNFVELVISTDSTQGWILNDSGKLMLFENGKPIKGTKNIGGVTYTFNKNGEFLNQSNTSTYGSYTVKSGDSWWKIANANNCNIFELAKVNSKNILSAIHVGEVIKLPQK